MAFDAVQHRVSLWVEGNESNPSQPTSSLAAVPAGDASLDSGSPWIKLNYEALEGIEVGDLLEVVPVLKVVVPGNGEDARAGKKWSNGPGLLFHVQPLPPGTLARQPGLQLSIPFGAAKAFQLDRHNRGEVLLRKVPSPVPPEYCADHIELFFKDQYLGRAEQLRISTGLANSSAYIGREVGLGALKVRTRVARIYIGGKRVYSGYITPFTNVVFRSESAKYYIFVQVSSEMWHFEEDGSLFHEKALLFLEDLFNRWSKIGTNHIVSLVLFSRVFYTGKEAREVPGPVLVSENDRHYKDFYRVIVDLETTQQWQKVLASTRKEISAFQYNVLTYLDPTTSERHRAGRLCYAHEGNILEAMGIACNSFDEHFIDRDLRRTGVSIVFVTAGTCVYDVQQLLLRSTVERFIDHGIGVDFVSLAKVPLHVVPLFRFQAVDVDADPEDDSGLRIDASRNPVYIDPPTPDAKATATYYNVPFFVDCSFYSRQADRPYRLDRFMPRCRMPQVEAGIGEEDLTGIQIPFLSDEMAGGDDEDPRKRRLARLTFDALAAGGAGPAGRSTGGTPKPIVPRRRVTSTERRPPSTPTKATPIPGRTEGFPQPPPGPSGTTQALRRVASSAASVSSAKNSKRDRTVSASATPSLITRLTAQAAQPQPAPTALSSIWPWSRNDQSGSTAAVSKATAAGRPAVAPATAGNAASRDTSLTPTVRPNKTPTGSKSTQPIPITVRAPSEDPTDHPPEKSRSAASERFNPSNPRVPSQGLLSQARRWSAIFPRTQNDQRSLKWKSLTTPGCLPMTTDFSPAPHELDTLYSMQEYNLPIDGTSVLLKVPSAANGSPEFFREAAVAALREAVSQRMSQAFQIVVPALSLYSSRLSPYARPMSGSLIGLLLEAEKGRGAYVDLSSSDHYHRLRICNVDTTKPTLQVQIFIRHHPWAAQPYEYRPAIWSTGDRPTWEASRILFEFPDLDSFDFRTLDSTIAGSERGIPLNDHLRYWRTRVAFLPAPITRRDFLPRDNLDSSSSDEEIRLAGIVKLQASLQHTVWRHPSEPTLAWPVFDFTPFDTAQYVRQESDRLIALAQAHQDQRERAGRILKDNTLEAIAEAMLSPAHGVDIRTRRWQVRSYEDVFCGDRMVTFLAHQFELPGREAALALGRRLQLQGLFRSAAASEKALVDGFAYYELCPPYAPPKAPKTSWFGRAERSERRARTATPDSKRSRSGSRVRRPVQRPRVEMTQSGVIELDPFGKSDRAERAIMHCDVSHSASNALHIELQWLGITSSLVDSLLQSWSRLVERYGIKMVEQNVWSLSSIEDFSPLQKTIAIRLASMPPPISDYTDILSATTTSDQRYFECQLLRSQGFVLDMEADSNFPPDVEVVYSYHRHPFEHSQFIHSTGAAVVQVREGGFLWADNVAARISARRFMAPLPDFTALRRGFLELCGDKTRLDGFWQDCIAKLKEVDCGTDDDESAV